MMSVTVNVWETEINNALYFYSIFTLQITAKINVLLVEKEELKPSKLLNFPNT